jgi:hypothetical protein
MSVVDVQDALGRKLPFELTPTSLPGAFISPAPPAEFDPLTASDAMLMKAGVFWRRPGPGDHPRLIEAWERVARRGWRPEDRIVPEFDVQVGVTHRLRGAKQVADGQFTSDNWSGATLRPPAGHSWSGAVGYWTIPTVSEPTEPQGTEGGWNSSSWVGIDGGYGSNDVLQAGIQQRVDAQGNASYVAWYEWFAPQQPNSPGYIWQTNISNFPVSPGQQVYCSAQYIGTTAGHLYFANDTTGQHFSITLAPPPGASFDGDTAEWIMETPDGGEGVASMPSFTPVHFQGAVCCGQNVPSGDPVNGDTWVIDGFGQQLTAVALATGSVTVTFSG